MYIDTIKNITIYIAISCLCLAIVLMLFHFMVKQIKSIENEKLKTVLPIFLLLVGIIPTLLATTLSEIIKYKNSIILQNQQRKEEMFKKRERVYQKMIENIDGFYNSEDWDKKLIFFSADREAWLYCPDNVIKSVKRFTETLPKSSAFTDEEKFNRLSEMLIEMRNDLIKLETITQTNLTPSDLNRVGPGPKKLSK